MTVTVAEVLADLAVTAPWAKAAGWDPVGLQVGDPEAPAARVGVCHEVTESVVDAVEAAPVDLLITYHPLLFRPTTRLVAGTSPAGRALRLARAGIALAVIHTNFDVAPGGTADALAAAVDLVDVAGFGPAWGSDSVKVVTFVPVESADAVTAAMAAAGAGRIGNYTSCSYRSTGHGTFFAGTGTTPVRGAAGALNTTAEVRLEMVAPHARHSAVVAAMVAAHPYEEPAFDVYDRRGDAGFVGRVGTPPVGTTVAALAGRADGWLGSTVRVAGDSGRVARRVAVVPGAGKDLIEDAGAAGADVMITGDVDHHRARAARDAGLAVIDPGHAATERPGMASLYAAVARVAPDAVDLTAIDPGPWEARGAWKS